MDPLRDDTDKEQAHLARLYQAKQRYLCNCKNPGIAMYIAKVNDRYILKRMPNSGSQHSPCCDSYDPPPELSGLGEVLGSAIKENEDGETELKFAFSMSRISGRAAITKTDTDIDSVKTDGSRLTLKSTLHYLWEDAGFNKWTPGMDGKRSWYIIRKYLLQSADTKSVKGGKLSERLYIPETFSQEKKDAIIKRRKEHISKLVVKNGKQRELMLFIGEVNEITEARFGYRIKCKHAADFMFQLNPDIHKRILTRYEAELGIWGGHDDAKLIVIGTFTLNAANLPAVEELSFMLVTANWIPFENASDKVLIGELTMTKRRFMKGLRYNLPKTKPLASIVLTDTAPHPTAMYIIPDKSDENYATAVDTLIAESALDSWTWNDGEYDIPEIPPPASKP